MISEKRKKSKTLRSTSKYILDIVLYYIFYVCFYLKHFICKEHIKILYTEKHNLYLFQDIMLRVVLTRYKMYDKEENIKATDNGKCL